MVLHFIASPRTRRWLATSLVVLVLLLAFFSLRRGTEDEVPARTVENARTDVAVEQTHSDDVSVSDRVPQPEPTTGATEAAAGPIHLTGSIEFLDQGGQQVPSAMGHITWTVVEPSGVERSMMTAVVDDQWTADVERDSILTPIRAMWSSRTRTQNSDVVQTPVRATEGEKRVTAHLSYGVTLRVVDSVTRNDLQDVTLVLLYPTSSFFQDTRLPPEVFLHGSEVSQHDSPVLLPNMKGVRVGWVHASSHAWARFAFTGEQGHVTVALSAGCDATVIARNIPKDAVEPTLLVYADADVRGQTDTLPLVERKIKEGGLTLLSGLPPGPVRFVISPYPRPRFFGPRLAEHRAVLVPGVRELVDLDLASPSARSEFGNISIRIDPAGSKGSLSSLSRVCVEPANGLNAPALEDLFLHREPDANGEYRYRCPNVLPGEYMVTLLPQGIQEAVEVRPGSTSEVHLVARGLCNVTVTALHGRTGRRLDDAVIQYRPARSSSAEVAVDVPCNGKDNTYSFRCSPGEYTLVAAYPGHRPLIQQVTIQNANEAIELQLTYGQGLAVDLRATQDGEDTLMRELFWRNVEVFAEGSDIPLYVPVGLNVVQLYALGVYDSARVTYFLPEPGAYEFRFPRLSGLKPIPPVRVNVDGGEMQPVRFEVAFE